MFEKLLIADRGEVALRIARTCERIGVASAAAHASAESGAPHVTGCDEAVLLETDAADPLADVAAVVAAAQRCGAQAIHPGYGPLCRDPRLARAAAEAGLAVVSTPAEVLERFAQALRARELANYAGVRPLPTSSAEPSSAQEAAAQALEIGYPIVVRAAAGGEIAERADDEDELAGAFDRCRARAAEAFGDDRVYLEHEIDRPRVLSVAVIGDGRECVALGEIERSVVHGSQILLAESPAPALISLPDTEGKRRALSDAAVRIALEGGFAGAGAVEFLIDPEGRTYFSRLVPGLPPEHVLSEMAANVDLVELQLRIAAGEPLPAEAKRAQPTGHAIEARIYAGDPLRGLSGPPVEISAVRWPMVAPGSLRVETDLAAGSRAATDVDPLVARVTAYGQTRHQALLTLDRVLAEATIEPLVTNLAFVREILADESYRAGQYDVGFVQRLLMAIKSRT
jgi:acetyl/propionyl-CoA carboxylase alpha subunit